jgi:hypothetical protein
LGYYRRYFPKRFGDLSAIGKRARTRRTAVNSEAQPAVTAGAPRRSPKNQQAIFNAFDALKSWRKWLGREDSNLRMAVPKTAALPLGDAPILKCEAAL